MPSLSVAEIAARIGSPVAGDASRLISSAAALLDATERDVSFVSGKQVAAASGSKAGCLIVPNDFRDSGPWAVIPARDPRATFARVLQLLYPAKKPAPSIHPTAVIGEGAQIAADAHVGAHVTIGSSTVVESGCVISDGCVLGDEVSIGRDTVLHSNVSVYDRVRIGARVVIHANAVLGADGFGFVFTDGHYEKFPQVGTLEIGDDVEIGAGCCIDRAALGVTRIGRGTKLDNLVHVAHNCSLGEHVVVAAQTGFSGSVTVGEYAVIGGQAGIGEKARIEARAVVGGKAGILTAATVHAGEPVWGIPARPLRKHLKGLANVNRLPELREDIRQLGHRLNALEKKREEA